MMKKNQQEQQSGYIFRCAFSQTANEKLLIRRDGRLQCAWAENEDHHLMYVCMYIYLYNETSEGKNGLLYVISAD